MSTYNSRLPIRFYRNTPNAFYRLTDGSFMRAVPAFKGSVMRRCDEKGRIIPRVRMSKKDRLIMRRMKAAMDAAA